MRKQHKRLQRQDSSHTIVFVMLTDGADTQNSTEALKSGIEALGRNVHGAGLQTVFKAVAIGKECDVSAAMNVS